MDDIIAEIEGRLGGLREDSAKAGEYLRLRDRYRDLEINITLRNIESIQSQNEAYKNDIAQLEKQVRQLSASKQHIDAEMEEDRQRSDALDKLNGQARDRLMELVSEINRLTSQDRVNRERLAAMEKEASRLEEESGRAEGEAGKKSGRIRKSCCRQRTRSVKNMTRQRPICSSRSTSTAGYLRKRHSCRSV